MKNKTKNKQGLDVLNLTALSACQLAKLKGGTNGDDETAAVILDNGSGMHNKK